MDFNRWNTPYLRIIFALQSDSTDAKQGRKMADKLKESKWFKVATAGPTVDGREIKEQWLKDMAETYDQDEYTASIFQDHYGWYGNYGQVVAVKAEKDAKGRLCLFAQIKANKMLLALNKAGQKLFTSIRVVEDFAETGKAYLMHLAITDEPASLGTEQLSFRQNGEHSQIFANEDGIELDFGASQTDEELAAEIKKRPNFLQRFFSNSPKEDDPMTDAEKAAFDKLQTQVDDFKTKLEALTSGSESESEEAPEDYAAQIKALEDKITTLESEKTEFANQAQTINTLKENFTKMQSDFAAALEDKTETPPKGKGEAGDSFEIF
ncbi:GPO family capsid scaffolding protein [Marinomonas transparens]|uniref:GPO family capsid scaffolding protein n=1 Tax=Marinomonas transparens TaxID=2795388 RepID=A0A934JT95_9GAMM|nr:GPO family capsid scaffolding protein [Marinomonas transparens]MBJ7536960.1 GPO family capsid scaffolding protein [Marinomonas transparens]